jgi:lysophospholipase L1-like esterase
VTESVTEPSTDARFTVGAGWTGVPITVNAGAGGTLTFADDNQADTWDICLLLGAGTAAATISISVDGVPTVFTMPSLSNPRVLTVRVSAGAVGTHTLVFGAPSVGSYSILSIDPTQSATPPVVKIGWVGISGQSLATLNPGSIGSGSNMSYLLNQYPDIAHLHMGINDMHTWGAGSGTPAAGAAVYQTNLAAWVSAFRAQNCDPVFTVWPSNGYAAQNPGVYEQLLWHQAIYAVADANNVAVLDLARRWGYGGGQTGKQAMYDGTHPTLFGYRDIATMVAGFLGSL